jgi:hypothetical protein
MSTGKMPSQPTMSTLKITIGFLLSTLLLVVFEYLLLQELYADKRIWLISISILGIALASFFFFFFFSRYHKSLKES